MSNRNNEFTELPNYIRNLKCHEFTEQKEKLALVVEGLVGQLTTTQEDYAKLQKEYDSVINDLNTLLERVNHE